MCVIENACAIYGNSKRAVFCYLWMAPVSSFGCVSCAKRVFIVEHDTTNDCEKIWVPKVDIQSMGTCLTYG